MEDAAKSVLGAVRARDAELLVAELRAQAASDLTIFGMVIGAVSAPAASMSLTLTGSVLVFMAV